MLKCVSKYGFILLLLIPLLGAAQTNKQEKLEKLKIRLQDEIELANRILSQTQKDKEVSLGAIETVQKKLKLRGNLIRTLDRELVIMDKDIDKINNDIDTLQKQVEKLKADYAKMIQQAYKSQNQYSRLMFILSSKDFNQALKRLEYLKQYSEYRRRQVEEIAKKQNDLNKKIADLNRQRIRKAALKGQMEKEKAKLLDEQTKQQEAIANLQQKETEIEKELKNKISEKKKLEKEIKRIIAAEIKRAKERAVRRQIEADAKKVGLIKNKDYTNSTNNKALKKLIEKKRKALAAANKPVKESAPTTTFTLTPEAKQLAANFTANKSRLPWPVERGLVVSTYGPHRHPVAKSVIIDNKGIDIATEKGGVARAVFDGEVISIFRVTGRILGVIVQHGDYFTLYQNIDKVYVEQGDMVKSKQALGTVFFNEKENKSVMQFQVWKGMQVLDPSPWLVSK